MLESLHANGVWNTAYCSTQRLVVPRVVTNFSEESAGIVRVNKSECNAHAGFGHYSSRLELVQSGLMVLREREILTPC